MLLALTAIGALLRFSTLGQQELWLDEAATAALMRLDVGDMLGTAAATESTPPLYYLLARGWSVVFGTGPVGLRSLSALAGTLTIPVMYAAGTALAVPRAGLVAAGLTAVSPPLVWFSQEARAYALVVLLSALTVLFMVRALERDGRRDLLGWALAAVLAVFTHYFASFLVAAEAVWLLAAHPSRRAATGAVGGVVIASMIAFVLAIEQAGQGNLDWIRTSPLPDRVWDTVELFLVGPTAGRFGWAVAALAIVGLGGLALAAPALARKADRSWRDTQLVAVWLVTASAAAAVLIAALGADYLVPRNLLPALPPALLVIAMAITGVRERRLATAVGIGLAVCWLALVVAVPLDRGLQRGAVTAALIPQPVDAELQRVVPAVAYARGEPARARCPEDHTAVGGGATLLAHGSDEPLEARYASGSALGWTAVAPPGATGRRVYVYAICVRPLD